MSVPTVSVVIPTYNKAEVIGATIDSVLRQTYQDFEIIVVDDGSKDDTRARVTAYGDRVQYVEKDNGGTGSARNLGIERARGRYVAFLDGDDLWLPEKLERQVAAFEREPGIDAVQCGAYYVDPDMRVLETQSCDPAYDTLLDFLLFRNLPAFASCVIIKKRTLETIGGFALDLVILSDWDMACRIARAGTLRSVPELLVLYLQYPGNQSKNVDIHIESGRRSLTRLFADPALPAAVRRREARIWARFYAMLAGGYVRNHEWRTALHWLGLALRTSPTVTPYLAAMPLRRLRKRLDGARGQSLAVGRLHG